MTIKTTAKIGMTTIPNNNDNNNTTTANTAVVVAELG